MSVVVNKSTLQVLGNQDPTNYDPATWLIDPVFDDFDRCINIGKQFWVIDEQNNTISSYTDEQILQNSTFLSQYQLDMWNNIKEERDRRKMECGYKVTTGGVDYWYHSDDTSRIQQIALVMLGANMPGNIMWKTMSGAFVSMNPTLAQQIFQAAIVSDMTLFSVAEQKRVAMQALADPRTYDWKSGWPKGYGE